MTRKKKLIIALIATAVIVWSPLAFLGITSQARANKEPVVTDVPVTTEKSKYEVGPPTAEELLELVNAERVKAGVAPLDVNANVTKSAQLKADDFSIRDYYSHLVKGSEYTLTDEMAGYINSSCSYSSENINGDLITSQQAIDSWMASEPHREAILDPKYTLSGIGVSQEKDGDYFAVQHFCIAK